MDDKDHRLERLNKEQSNRNICDEFSDFTIKCQGHEFKVHRSMIVGHSEYLDALIQTPFKEANEGCAEFPEDDPAIIAVLIWYIYTSKYPRMPPDQDFSDEDKCALLEYAPFAHSLMSSRFSLHVKIAKIADRMLLQTLGDCASMALSDSILGLELNNEAGDRTDFEEAVRMLYEGEDVLWNMKQRVAWRIVHSIATHQWHFSCMSSLVKKLPDLGWILLREAIGSPNHDIDNSSCHRCETLDRMHGNVNFLVSDWKSKGQFNWMKCECDYRGFCSTACRIAEGEEQYVIWYCSNCKDSSTDWGPTQYMCGMGYDHDKKHLVALAEEILCLKHSTNVTVMRCP